MDDLVSIQQYDSRDIDTLDPYISNTEICNFLNIYNTKYNFEKILEVGCGNGRVARLLTGYVDYPVTCIDGYRKPNPEFLIDSLLFFNKRLQEFETSEKFDLIILVGTFFILDNPDYRTNLIKLTSLLTKTGNLVIIENFTRFIEDGFDLERFQKHYKNTKQPWKQEGRGFFNLHELLTNTNYKIKDTIDLNLKYRAKIIGEKNG